MMDPWDQNLHGPYRGYQRMQHEQNGHNNIPHRVYLYEVNQTYSNVVEPPYPIQQGANLQQAHSTYQDAEPDHMSLGPPPYLHYVASGQVPGGLPSSSQSCNNGQPSASGFSNPGMNIPARHLRVLPSSNSDADLGSLVTQDTSQLIQILRRKIENYDDKKKNCLESFKEIGHSTGRAEPFAIKCLYIVNDMVKCLICKNSASPTDRFQHKESCEVSKAIKEFNGYSSSSDDESIPQTLADSDESMSLERNDSTNTASTRGEIPRELELESLFASATGSQNPTGPQPFSNFTSYSEGRLPTDGKSGITISKLMGMGYDYSTIYAIFQVKGPKCLESPGDFFDCQEEVNSLNLLSNNTTGVQSIPFSVSDTPSGYATAGGFTQSGSYAQSNSSGQGSNDVILPPTLYTNTRDAMFGADNVNLNYQFCLGCKKEHPCVTQRPCAHVVCKRCADKSNICAVCNELVKKRGVFDLGSFG